LMGMYEVVTAIPLSMPRILKSRRKPFRALLQPALRKNRHQKICICCLVVSWSRYLPVRQWKVSSAEREKLYCIELRGSEIWCEP
jgi:hypothetical protein